jgi:hypothetical protein
MQVQRQRARVDECRQDLDRLGEEVRAWVDTRVREDTQGQHRTQLGDLGAVLDHVVGSLRREVDAVDAAQPRGIVYETCRRLDRGTLLARRLFAYYRDRFDQRRDPLLGSVVRAADEIVWSCWAEPFRRAGGGVAPAPLPYVEPEASARATARADPPAELAPRRDDVFAAALAELPIPLIGIPPGCVPRPWSLVVLAHEVGHQVQYDLADGALLPATSGALVELTGDERWGAWSREAFADAASTLLVGPAGGGAIAELEAGTDGALLRPSAAYPAPVVRQALMAAILAVASNGDPQAALAASRATIADAQLTPEEGPLRADAEAQLAKLPEIASTLVRRPFDGVPALSELLGWNAAFFAPQGDVARWRQALLARAEPVPQRTARAARLVTAGAYAAWDELADSEADVRPRLASLAERTSATVERCREEGVRAAERPAATRLAAAAEAVSALVLADALSERAS